MRVLIQRVESASVSISDKVVSSIERGLLLFVGIETADTSDDVQWCATKVVNMRLFPDTAGVMNLSAIDIDADIMIVSQFTLQANIKKGNRPSYIKAARPEVAIPLYQSFIDTVESHISKKPATGVFGADMKVSLINDGPVTIWVDSKLNN